MVGIDDFVAEGGGGRRGLFPGRGGGGGGGRGGGGPQTSPAPLPPPKGACGSYNPSPNPNPKHSKSQGGKNPRQNFFEILNFFFRGKLF